jgi:hypothetical protein
MPPTKKPHWNMAGEEQKHISITSASRVTATRDLVDKGASSKTGELKGTRCFLRLGGLMKMELI